MEKSIVQIICGNEVGTAFYVAPNFLLTADHIVTSFNEAGKSIVKDAVDGDLKYVVVKHYEDADIALLKVEGRSSFDNLLLLSHHVRIGEKCISFGYPDAARNSGQRVEGYITQKLFDSAGDFTIRTEGMDDAYDYQGMSGAPVWQGDKVVGVVIEQSGNSLNVVSVQKMSGFLVREAVSIEEDVLLTDIPETIAKDVDISQPNYRVFELLDEELSKNNNWLLLFGSPGCGKTTLSACYKPSDEAIEVLGRYFFKVPNDIISRAVRCSEGSFLEWLESVYIAKTGIELEIKTLEDKRKSVAAWLRAIDTILSSEHKQGVIIIDGLDELATDSGSRVDVILSLLPESLPSNIKVILSCISENILPANVIGKIGVESRIEVTPLEMASCETFIYDNSGKWEKPYSFIQAVAHKTEGHPLYMNYLCRYISDTFDATTKIEVLIDWVNSLPSIGGDIRSYYDALWKKVDPNGFVYEVLAILSQARGPLSETQLVNMMLSPNPYEFKSATVGFRHLMKEQESDLYEIYHSSFRLYITEKLSSTVNVTNDQIAKYCETNKESLYSIENHLHHVVNGSDVKEGLSMCNQEWADTCAMNDVSPDLVMHDIKECLSFAVDLSLPLEVIRLMLLAQRIETRCDSIMVDNVSDFADLKIAMGKPDVALKYLVRDNILLINEVNATTYLQILYNLGYEEQANKLSDAIDASIRNDLRDTTQKGIRADTLLAKGFLIIERISAGIEDVYSFEHYLNILARIMNQSDDNSAKTIKYVQDFVVAYFASNTLRKGEILDIKKYLTLLKGDWKEDVVMLFIRALLFYEESERLSIKIGYNEAYYDCLKQIEEALTTHSFGFAKEELRNLLDVMLFKSNQVELVEKLIIDYDPNPGEFVFRSHNGVDFEGNAFNVFYDNSLLKAYSDKKASPPSLTHNYYSDSGWESYMELIIRHIAYASGQLFRKKALGEDYQNCYAFVKETLDYLDFTLEIRVRWKRAYLLPEELLPFIYEKLLGIYCEFFSDKIEDFAEHIKSRMPDQLGVYREGYCATLIRLINVINDNPTMRNLARFLTDETLRYVLYAVQNRSERCWYLIKICRYYALMGEKKKTELAYQELLDSSMGPDWYKEAQLDLINVFKEGDIKLDGGQSAHLSAIFDEASGEMTFQRYVQQEKDEFVATLAKVSSVSDAIAYYKYETLPSAETVINNAEGWKVDMPMPGEGYDLGANHLIESSAICQLLLECNNVSPYIRYAISELFWENWDKMHNDYNYAQLHTDILNSVGEKEALKEFVPRMAEYFVAEYYHDKKGVYLNDLEKNDISSQVFDGLENSLSAKGYKWKRENKKTVKEEQKESLEYLLANMPDCKSVLERMRKEIVSPLGSYWYSLNVFLGPLIKKPDFDKSKLFEVISSHYDANVHPSDQQNAKFNWFSGVHEETDVEEQMIHFLIWFMVHPDGKIVRRAKDSLLWLVNYDNRVVDCLIDEVLNPSEIGLRTESSAILLEIASSAPDIVLEKVKLENRQNRLCEVRDFSVSRNLYEVALILADNCGYDGLLQIVRYIIPDSLPDRGDVVLENKDMMFIEHKIDKLNNLGVTGGREFAKPYLDLVHSLENDGSITRLIDSDKYIRRSFYLDYFPKGRYDRAMEDVLNKVLYGKVDYNRACQVYYAINS